MAAATPAGIGNTSGSNDRQACTACTICGNRAMVPTWVAQVVAQEDTAMTTCFQPLGNDGVGAVRLQPQRFVYGGGRGQNQAAPGF